MLATLATSSCKACEFSGIYTEMRDRQNKPYVIGLYLMLKK